METNIQVFSEAWFAKHQRIMLWFLNAPILWRVSRKVLGIQSKSLICKVSSSFFNEALDNNRRRLTAFSGEVIGKQLYRKFKPVWWLMHFIDWLVLDRLIPKLSFGFSTLTKYPDSGSGSTTCDGNVYRNTGAEYETFATIRAGAGTNADNTTTSSKIALISGSIGNNFTNLYRVDETFNTSDLTSAAVIETNGVQITHTGKTNKFAQLGTTDFHVCGATPAANNSFVAADYGQFGTTSFGSIAWADWNQGGENTLTLNASGIAAINKTGVTALGCRLGWDIENSYRGNSNTHSTTNYIWSSADDSGGTTTAPKLVVTYTLPAGNALLFAGD